MKKRIFISVILYALIISMLLGAFGIFAGASDGNGLTIEGAQIRTEGIQGLRFVAKVDRTKFDLTTGENANFGILLIPSNMIGKDESITIDTYTVKDVKAKNLMTETNEYYEFTAVLLNIPAEYYGTELVARAYVKNGNNYTYSEQLTRSVKFVAEEILKDSDASEIDIEVAKNVLNKYAEVGGDILVDAENIWRGTNVLTAYPEYPEQIARDYMYSVSVSQKKVTKDLVVYNQTQEFFYTDRFAGDTNRRFCEFAFSGAEVTVNVKVNTDFSTYAVIPTSKGFESEFSNGVISITMDKPEQLVVILDDDIDTALTIFADAPEVDTPSADKFDIYVKGWNEITIKNNCATYQNGVLNITKEYVDIYIEPGAVLLARVLSEQTAKYLTISGRGAIVDPLSRIYDEYEDAYDYSSNTPPSSLLRICGTDSVIKDIKLLDARCFNLNVDAENNKIENVKILSTMMQSDGITTKTEAWSKGIVKNCFIYCGDNALVTSVGSGKTGYSFENITVGTTCAAIYPQFYVNAKFTDIYVFRADEGLINIKEESNTKTIEINNLDALDCVRTPWLLYANSNQSSPAEITFNKILMRCTTGDATATSNVGANTNSKAMFVGDSTSGSFTLNIKDMYVGGTLITSDGQLKSTGFTSLTKTYSTTGETPVAISGNKLTASYNYDRNVFIGNREIFLESDPIISSGVWYLPYNEIVSYLSVVPSNPETITIGEIEMISVENLIESGAIKADSNYNSITKTINLIAATSSSTNLLKDDYNQISNYNPYKYNTPYLMATYTNNTWEYTAKLASSSSAGIVRMLTELYRQYGEGSYTISFDIKTSKRGTVKVGLAVDHTEDKYSNNFTFYSTSWQQQKSWTVNITDDPASIEQLALTFKPVDSYTGDLEGATISIRNIKIVKN